MSKYFLFFIGFSAALLSCNLSQEHFAEVFPLIEDSIDRIEDGIIFLKAESVHCSAGEFYIVSPEGEKTYFQEFLSIDGEPCLAMERRSSTRPVWICANYNCARLHHYKPEKCEKCSGTTFIVRYIQKNNALSGQAILTTR